MRRRAHILRLKKELEARRNHWIWKMLRKKTFKKWITLKLIMFRKQNVLDRKVIPETASQTYTYGIRNQYHAKYPQTTTMQYKYSIWINPKTAILSIRVIQIWMKTFHLSCPRFKIIVLRRNSLNLISAPIQDKNQAHPPKIVLQLRELRWVSKIAITILPFTTMHP